MDITVQMAHAAFFGCKNEEVISGFVFITYTLLNYKVFLVISFAKFVIIKLKNNKDQYMLVIILSFF